jgi:hypothetical protein
MRNIILPDSYSKEKLEKAKKMLMEVAGMKYGEKIELPGRAEKWDDCFTGFPKHSQFILCFSFNVGVNTFSVCDHFDIYPED